MNPQIEFTNNADYEYSPNQQIRNNRNSIVIAHQKLAHMTKRQIMEAVQNKINYKFETTPIMVRSAKTAQKVVNAINYYVGGTEVNKICENRFVITSKGYYHYIGA